MLKNKRLRNLIVPSFIAINILVLLGLFLIYEVSIIYVLLLGVMLTGGYWIGLLNNPGVIFRQKKVKKQSIDLLKLNEQIKIQTAAMESAANGIIITDTKGIVQWVNPGFSRLTGYSSAESIGFPLKKLNSGVHDQNYFKELWTTILGGNVWHNEIVNRRKDGALYTEEMTITPIMDKMGKPKNFVAIKQDISERKRLEEISKTEKDRMKTELDVARNIQMSLLNLDSPPFPERKDIDIFAHLIPAREVGGDFYDFFWIDEENLCFFVGDVSGKGVPAAIMMAVTKTLLKSGVNQEKSAGKVLSIVNQEINKDNDNYMFITVFLAILNTTTGYLTYSNAGHNPSFLLDRKNNELKKMGDLHGVVIGAMEGTEYSETLLRIARGDTILIYTDGVTEARDIDNNLFSDERFFSFVEERISHDPTELVEEIIQEVKIHENGAEPADDITLLCIEYKEPEEGVIKDYLSVSITNKIENIQSLIKQFEDFANNHRVPDEAIQQVNIVFDELLSNTIQYAYRDGEVHEIEVKIQSYSEKLTVTIMDDGAPYNPFDRSEPDTSLALEDRGIGGLGVHLVKFLVDDYDYEYKEQIKKNKTHFTKKFI